MLNRDRRSRDAGDPAIARAHRGFSLTELMIAIALGLFLVSGIAFMMYESAKASRQALLEAHLRQTLMTVMSVMTGELRRAGYWSRAGLSADLLHNGYAPLRLVAGDCLLFSYDRESGDTDGLPAPGDRHGLRLSNGALQIKTSDPGCGADLCESCNSGNWLALTDPQTVTVTGLRFTETPGEAAFNDGDNVVIVRGIGITLEGRLKTHPGIRHRLQAAVDIRNDKIR
jgi:prepilin peptidase dependent protein B